MLCTMWPTFSDELSLVASGEGGKTLYQNSPNKEPKQANFDQNSHFVAKET